MQMRGGGLFSSVRLDRGGLGEGLAVAGRARLEHLLHRCKLTTTFISSSHTGIGLGLYAARNFSHHVTTD